MHQPRTLIGLLAAFGATAALVGCATTASKEPPADHCPAASCPTALMIAQGSAVEPKTGRKFYLDYPTGWKKGDKVTFILALHGGGSYGNWQRNYFPLMDYKDKYHLVIATPNAPVKKALNATMWDESDDAYVQNIVNQVYEQVGKENIKAFWLVGHSQGGITSNRLIRTEFFKSRVNGWLSLSGGRLGPTPPIPASFFAGFAATPAAPGAAPPALPRLPPQPTGLPDGNFSFIFETGEHELGEKPIPEASPWADKLGCSARVPRATVVDTVPGYVYDPSRQNPGSDAWGHLPRPGKAEISVYPKCKNGRVVADVVRFGKGHTEGLEPKISEELIKLMLSAK